MPAKACSLVSNLKLKKFLLKNLFSISFDDQAIEKGRSNRLIPISLLPLADVPDIVWRNSRKKDSGNHFADMDQEGKGQFEGKTLLELTKDPINVNVKTWNSFYDSLGIGAKEERFHFEFGRYIMKWSNS